MKKGVCIMLEKIMFSLGITGSIFLTAAYSIAGLIYALFVASVIVIFNGAVKGRKT